MACKKCGHKLILGKTHIGWINPDEEPYESGETVKMNDIDCDVWLEVHWCETCKIIHDVWDDDNVNLIRAPAPHPIGSVVQVHDDNVNLIGKR